VFRGTSQLRDELFDQGLRELRPSLDVRALLVEGASAAAVLHEVLVVGGDSKEFDIAVFFAARDGQIETVTVFREGSADIAP
jgi:hypothetical protein